MEVSQENRVEKEHEGSISEMYSTPKTPIKAQNFSKEDAGVSGTNLSSQVVNGDVALTPTNSSFTPQPLNPHNSMTALTPMPSASTQAKSSIKLQ